MINKDEVRKEKNSYIYSYNPSIDGNDLADAIPFSSNERIPPPDVDFSQRGSHNGAYDNGVTSLENRFLYNKKGLKIFSETQNGSTSNSSQSLIELKKSISPTITPQHTSQLVKLHKKINFHLDEILSHKVSSVFAGAVFSQHAGYRNSNTKNSNTKKSNSSAGLVNGNGIIFRNGILNGNGIVYRTSLVNGNGFVNGRIFNGDASRRFISHNNNLYAFSRQNSWPYSFQGKYNTYYLSKVRKRRSETFTWTVILLLLLTAVLAPLMILVPDYNAEIRIDGLFRDWYGKVTYRDFLLSEYSGTTRETDILSASVVSEGEYVYIFLETAGVFFDARCRTNGSILTTLYFDLDSNSSTGYGRAGVGAEA
ncbi:MAG: hypothetical protein QW728_07870, partial [Thermoplasmata archaeon]